MKELDRRATTMHPGGGDDGDAAELSPLYELNSRLGEIRQDDYGDREDVIAEQEELQHEIESLDVADSSPTYYPPSGRHLGRRQRRRKGLSAISLGLRKHRVKVRSFLCLAVLWPFISWAVVYSFFSFHPALFPRSLKDAKSTLFIVAHPDDESLFFAPSILASVRRAKSHGALLVMSSGNHYGLGDVRKRELLESCHQLGIREERCDVIDVPSVQDDPNHWWPTNTIIDAVRQRIDRWMIDSLVTFDQGGVSGHINHRAVSAAVTQLALSLNSTKSVSSAGVQSSPSLFVVKSVFVLRKYLGLYDLGFSFIPFIPAIVFGPGSQLNLPMAPAYDARTERNAHESETRRKAATKRSERGLLLSGWAGYRAALKAFWCHRSQLVWDRYLYVLISQYMYFNTVERVV